MRSPKWLPVISALVLLVVSSSFAHAEGVATKSWRAFGNCLMLDFDECDRFWRLETRGLRKPYHEVRLRSEVEDEDYDGALVHMNALIDLYPNDPQNYFLRAYIFEQKNMWGIAADDYNQALLLGMAGDRIYYYLATAHDMAGEPTVALKFMNTAIELRPDDAERYVSRSMILDELGEYTRAAADVDFVIAKWPSYAPGYNGKCWGLAKFESRYDEAMEFCDKALELYADYAAAIHSRGYIYLMRGEKEKAIADFRRALALGDEDPSVADDLERALALP